MIQSLSIRNIALIEELTIEFHTGLQVLSGETGAGKSIVVDAVNLVLGGRADRSMIRSGCDKAAVEAVFTISDAEDITPLFQREKIEYDGYTVSIYREISASGKNICRICGIIMPLSFLKELAPKLMNLHGQSEHQLLADPLTHLRYLDQLGSDEHRSLIEKTRKSCELFMTNHREYARLMKENEDKDFRMEKIRKDLEELHHADLKENEEEELRNKVKQMEEAGKITSGLKKAYYSMITGEGNGGVLQNVKEAADQLRRVMVHDPQAAVLAEKCEALYYELEDLAYQISNRMDQFEFDPVRLEQTETRLDMIRRIERKFGPTIKDVLQAEAELESEYNALCGLDDRIRQIGAEHKKRLSDYRQAARELSESRKNLAKSFSNQMICELRDLGMAQTVFDVRFSSDNSGKPKMPTSTGDDTAEFVISPNPGEPLMPLAQIASGGELSRLMLAMKTLEAGHTGVDCMVFDEIDTGISGKTAQTVAEKMIAISRHHQVICVSHLPQLAAAGDWQYLVSKHTSGDRTTTSVSQLSREGRIREIARMISGADGINREASEYAEQMLRAAENKRKQISGSSDDRCISKTDKKLAN